MSRELAEAIYQKAHVNWSYEEGIQAIEILIADYDKRRLAEKWRSASESLIELAAALSGHVDAPKPACEAPTTPYSLHCAQIRKDALEEAAQKCEEWVITFKHEPETCDPCTLGKTMAATVRALAASVPPPVLSVTACANPSFGRTTAPWFGRRGEEREE